MTDCCLCVWCRPAPHRRLVLSLYPPGAKGNEAGLLPVNASKVTQYARARPVFLPTIAKDLCKRAKNDWKRGRIGFALIALSALEQLVEACSSATPSSVTDASTLAVFEESVVDVIHVSMAFSHPDVKLGGTRLCARFISGHDILADQARLQAFLPPLLGIFSAASADGSFELQMAALQAIKQLLLKSTPQSLVQHAKALVPILLPVMHREVQAWYRLTTAQATATPSGTLSLLDDVIVTLAGALNPAIASSVLATFFAFFDSMLWQPVPLVLRVLRMLDPANTVLPDASEVPTDVSFSPPGRAGAGAVGLRSATTPSPHAPPPQQQQRATTSSYTAPTFIPMLRHLVKVDEICTCLTEALPPSAKAPEVRVTVPVDSASAGTVVGVGGGARDWIAPSPLTTPPPTGTTGALSSTATAGAGLPGAGVGVSGGGGDALPWLRAVRDNMPGAGSVAVACARVAASRHDTLSSILADFYTLRINILRLVLPLIRESNTPLGALYPDAFAVLVPILVEPTEPDLAALSARTHDVAMTAVHELVAKLSAPQEVLRCCSELCEWYLDHLIEYRYLEGGTLLSPGGNTFAMPFAEGGGGGGSSERHVHLSRSGGGGGVSGNLALGGRVSSSKRIVPSSPDSAATNVTAAATAIAGVESATAGASPSSGLSSMLGSRRLSRWVGSDGLPVHEVEPGAVSLAKEQATAARHRILLAAHGGFLHLRHVVSRGVTHLLATSPDAPIVNIVGRSKLTVTPSTFTALECALGEGEGTLRAVGAWCCHHLLSLDMPLLSSAEGDHGRVQWMAGATRRDGRAVDIFPERGSSASGSIGGESGGGVATRLDLEEPGWLSRRRGIAEILRFPARESTRITSLLYHAILEVCGVEKASARERASGGAGAVGSKEGAVSVAATPTPTPTSARIDAGVVGPQLALCVLVARDLLRLNGVEGLWRTVPLAFTLQSYGKLGVDEPPVTLVPPPSTTASRPGSGGGVVSTGANGAPLPIDAVGGGSGGDDGVLPSISEEEECERETPRGPRDSSSYGGGDRGVACTPRPSPLAGALWVGSWAYLHGVALALVRVAAHAVGCVDLQEELTDTATCRSRLGVSGEAAFSTLPTGMLAAPDATPALVTASVPVGGEVGADALPATSALFDGDSVAASLLSLPSVRHLLSREGYPYMELTGTGGDAATSSSATATSTAATGAGVSGGVGRRAGRSGLPRTSLLSPSRSLLTPHELGIANATAARAAELLKGIRGLEFTSPVDLEGAPLSAQQFHMYLKALLVSRVQVSPKEQCLLEFLSDDGVVPRGGVEARSGGGHTRVTSTNERSVFEIGEEGEEGEAEADSGSVELDLSGRQPSRVPTVFGVSGEADDDARLAAIRASLHRTAVTAATGGSSTSGGHVGVGGGGVPSALDYERAMLAQEGGRGGASVTRLISEGILLGSHRETPLQGAVLDPFRQAKWLRMATDPATFFQLEHSHELAVAEIAASSRTAVA